jgi:hypothetical protein
MSMVDTMFSAALSRALLSLYWVRRKSFSSRLVNSFSSSVKTASCPLGGRQLRRTLEKQVNGVSMKETFEHLASLWTWPYLGKFHSSTIAMNLCVFEEWTGRGFLLVFA